MSEWHIIPSYPNYEITRQGDIRTSDEEFPVQSYMGRSVITEDLHPRVRLRDWRQYPIAIAVEDLLVETFPDYVRPDRNVQVEEPAKKQKRVADRDLKIVTKKQGHVYTEEELKDKEFRVIPGFSKYKITQCGILYSVERKMFPTRNRSSAGALTYHVYADEGHKTTRTGQSLSDLAFPEFAKPRKEAWKVSNDTPVYRARNDWRHIPGWPVYEIHADGTVRYSRQRRMIDTKTNSLNGEKYVNLRDAEGISWPIGINDLLELVRQREEEKAAA